VQISSTNTSGPMSLLQSINAHLIMNTENQSLFKANYCVFKWPTITHFPNWRGVLIKLLFFFCHGYFEEQWMYPFLIVGTRYPTIHTAQCIPPLEVKLQDLLKLVWKNSTLLAGVLTYILLQLIRQSKRNAKITMMCVCVYKKNPFTKWSYQNSNNITTVTCHL
jgi:hypothetical protein